MERESRNMIKKISEKQAEKKSTEQKLIPLSDSKKVTKVCENDYTP